MTEENMGVKLFEHAEKIRDLALSMHKSCLRKQNKVLTNYRQVLSALFSRSLELFDSILILVREDRIVDAGLLLRSLTNLLINLGYIDRNKEERATLMLFDLATQHKRLYMKLKEYPSSPANQRKVDHYLQHYTAQETLLKEEIERRYPDTTPWHKVRIIDRAAANSDLQDIYNTIYADLSRFEHHDFSALRAYVNPDTCNPVITTGPKRHSPLLNHESILESTIPMVGIIMEFFNSEYQLKWHPKIVELNRIFMDMTGLIP